MASNDDYTAPVNHSFLSGATSTVTSAAGHGLKSGASAAFKWVLGFAAVGAVVGLLASTGLLMPLLSMSFGAAGASIGGVSIGGVLGGTLIGGGVAALIGGMTSGFPAVFGGLYGVGKGAIDGSNRVRNEKAAYTAVSAQLSAMQAQAPQTHIYNAPAQENHITPAQGSKFNQAASGIQADSVAYDGKMDQRSLGIA